MANRIRINISLQPNVLEKLKEDANSSGMTVSAYLTSLIMKQEK